MTKAVDDLIDHLLSMGGPVAQATEELRLADYEATRTDPWTWYCRLCGATGEATDLRVQQVEAEAHLADEHPEFKTLGATTAGRLLHVWSYNE